MSDTTTTKPTEGTEGYLSWATHLQNGVREYIAKEGNIILRGWQHSVQGFLASDVGKALSMAAIAYAEAHGVPEERIDDIDHVIHNAITLAIAEMPAEDQALMWTKVPGEPLPTMSAADLEARFPDPPPFPTVMSIAEMDAEPPPAGDAVADPAPPSPASFTEPSNAA